MDPEVLQRARGLALRRLARREQSRLEMIRYLEGHGVDSEAAIETVAKLITENLLDDKRYARMMIREQVLRGKGPMMIARKLKEKGIKMEQAEIREIATESTDTTELDNARRIVERRYPRMRSDRNEANKAYQALLRRGFSHDIARKAVLETPPSASDEELD